MEFAESAADTGIGIGNLRHAVFIANNDFFGTECRADTAALAPVPEDGLGVFFFGFLVAVIRFRSGRFNLFKVSHRTRTFQSLIVASRELLGGIDIIS